MNISRFMIAAVAALQLVPANAQENPLAIRIIAGGTEIAGELRDNGI